MGTNQQVQIWLKNRQVLIGKAVSIEFADQADEARCFHLPKANVSFIAGKTTDIATSVAGAQIPTIFGADSKTGTTWVLPCVQLQDSSIVQSTTEMTYTEVAQTDITGFLPTFFGDSAGLPYVVLDATNLPEETILPEQIGWHWSFVDFREVLSSLDTEGYAWLSRCAMLLHWHKQTTFCGVCGHTTKLKTDEVAKQCTHCQQVTYPRISPAIIVAIMKDREILLAHAKHFPEGLYSLIAGFVEPGETLEMAVAREVEEEVGIAVQNIRYYGSQSWAFPDSLMVGFVAEYKSGDIRPDGVEITDANWYTPDALPNIPSTVSIAGKIIRTVMAVH